jgi:hypothetical protein
MKHVKTYLAVGAATAALVGGAYFTAQASAQAPGPGTTPPSQQQQSGPHPVRFEGKLTAVGANSVTLTTGKATVTANVGPNTWIVVNKNNQPTQGTLSDLQTGKPATVAGMSTGTANTVDARVITQGVGKFQPGGNGGPGKGGPGKGGPGKGGPGKGGKPGNVGPFGVAREFTVSSVSGSNISVTNSKGMTLTITTTSNTVVLNKGFSTVSALQPGAKIEVLGKPERTDKNAPATAQNVQLDAWAIRVVGNGTELRMGRVASVSGSTIVIRGPKDRAGVTVNLGSATIKSATPSGNGTGPVIGAASLSDVKVGGNIIVEGTVDTTTHVLSADAAILVMGMPTK